MKPTWDLFVECIKDLHKELKFGYPTGEPPPCQCKEDHAWEENAHLCSHTAWLPSEVSKFCKTSEGNPILATCTGFYNASDNTPRCFCYQYYCMTCFAVQYMNHVVTIDGMKRCTRCDKFFSYLLMSEVLEDDAKDSDDESSASTPSLDLPKRGSQGMDKEKKNRNRDKYPIGQNDCLSFSYTQFQEWD